MSVREQLKELHPIERFRRSTIGRSIWRVPDPKTPRDAAAKHWASFFMHIYPVKMRREEVTFRYTWYLGISSLVLFLVLVATGVILMFFYVPSPQSAYLDIQRIQAELPFGQFLRNAHRWAAHLMVFVVAAHMARVFYRGAYKPPKEFNWVVGVVLLVLTLLLSFTGYLLPWDQLAYWAITVGSSMAGFVPFLGDISKKLLLGGPEVGATTLLRFYVLHVAVLPLLLALVVTIHLWRWRKDTMLAPARTEDDLPVEAIVPLKEEA